MVSLLGPCAYSDPGAMTINVNIPPPVRQLDPNSLKKPAQHKQSYYKPGIYRYAELYRKKQKDHGTSDNKTLENNFQRGPPPSRPINLYAISIDGSRAINLSSCRLVGSKNDKVTFTIRRHSKPRPTHPTPNEGDTHGPSPE